MIAPVLRVFFWACAAHLFCCAISSETPKECLIGTSDYNETLCNETCTNSVHANKSYCTNFTQPIGNVQNQQEVANPVALSGIMTSTSQEGIHLDLTTPNVDLNDVMSSAVSLDASLAVSAVASICVLLFAYFQ